MCQLPQQLKKSSSIFQNCIENILPSKTKTYDGSHWMTFRKKVTIDETKSNSKPLKTVSFLDCSVSADGIKPYDRPVETIILGTGKLLRTVDSEVCNHDAPTQRLTESTNRHNKCFQSIKEELCSKLVERNYSLEKKVTVTIDASEQTAGAFSQKMDTQSSTFQGSYHQLSATTPTGIEKLWQLCLWPLKNFLLGRKFTLKTDNKSLQYLFAPDGKIPRTVSARITRWAIGLISFDYSLNYSHTTDLPSSANNLHQIQTIIPNRSPVIPKDLRDSWKTTKHFRDPKSTDFLRKSRRIWYHQSWNF